MTPDDLSKYTSLLSTVEALPSNEYRNNAVAVILAMMRDVYAPPNIAITDVGTIILYWKCASKYFGIHQRAIGEYQWAYYDGVTTETGSYDTIIPIPDHLRSSLVRIKQ